MRSEIGHKLALRDFSLGRRLRQFGLGGIVDAQGDLGHAEASNQVDKSMAAARLPTDRQSGFAGTNLAIQRDADLRLAGRRHTA